MIIDRPTALRGAALGTGLAVATWVSVRTGAPGADGTATIWLGNAFQLGVLLLAPRRRWPGCLAGFTAVTAVVVLIVDGDPAGALATSLVNLAEVALAAHLLSRDPDWIRGRSDSTASWLRFAVCGVLVAPLVGTLLGVLAVFGLARHGLEPGWLWDQAHVWFVTDAVAICVVVPFMLRVRPAALARLRAEHRLREGVVLLVVLAALAGAVLSQGNVIALFALMPPLIVLLFRFGFVGLAAGTAVMAPFALGLTRAGEGPFVTMADSPAQAVLVAQLFLVSVFGTVATIGALLEERQRLADGEAANEQVYRLIAASSSDMILVLTDDGAAKYVSPAATELAGRPETALLGLGWLQQLHPDDRDTLVGAFNQVRDGDRPAAEIACRLRRSEQDWRWLEVRLRSGGNAGPLIVATVRDVTGRREYEENLRAENALLAQEASTDALTGLANRREFEQRLAAEWARASAAGQQVSLVVVDVDHFKKYNDGYGHAAGDRCLASVARALRGTLRRPSDLCARYGGEEFVVLLPGTHRAGAAVVGEALCAAVRRLHLEHRENAGGIVTISAGVASSRADDATPEELFARADAALYRAKEAGRDRSEVHHEETPGLPAVLAGT